MRIFKLPQYENDSYYFAFHRGEIENLRKSSGEYYQAKRDAFRNFATSKEPFKKFDHLPSFRHLNDLKTSLRSTIYTVAAERKNDLTYFEIIEMVRNHKDNSRRCVVNFADPLDEYIDDTIDTSCLLAIHYHRDCVKIIFRASDMTNELLHDLNLIYEFFIWPIYGDKAFGPEIHVFSSTAQNIINPLNYLI